MLNSLVTIIIPVFNAADTLARCLRAAMTQSHKNIEIIVVDDGSCDESVSIAERHAFLDHRIHVFRQSNQGAGPARNAGMERAQGEYIVFSDADDTMDKDMVSLLLKGVEASGSAWGICGYRVLSPDSDGAIELRLNRDGKQKVAVLFKGFTRGDPNALGKFSSQCNKIYRKSVIDRGSIRFLPRRRYEDFHFNLAYIKAAPEAYFVDLPLFTYNRHGRNVTLEYRPQGFEENQELYDIIREYAGGELLSPVESSMLERHYIDKTIIIMRMLCRDNPFFDQGEVQKKLQMIVEHSQVRHSLEVCALEGTQPERLLEMMRNREYEQLYTVLRSEVVERDFIQRKD